MESIAVFHLVITIRQGRDHWHGETFVPAEWVLADADKFASLVARSAALELNSMLTAGRKFTVKVAGDVYTCKGVEAVAMLKRLPPPWCDESLLTFAWTNLEVDRWILAEGAGNG